MAVLRRPGGCLLQIDSDRVDAHRFRRLVDRARRPDIAAATQAQLLRQALDLWRGPALADLSSGWAGRVRHTLQQHRLAAARRWAQVELQLGRPGTVVEELLGLTAEHPSVEPLLALLMCALHADGRDAEALEQYASARGRLAEELGVDPGPELRRVHEARGQFSRVVDTRGRMTDQMVADLSARAETQVTALPGGNGGVL